MTLTEGLHAKRRELEEQVVSLKQERALLRALLLIMLVVSLVSVLGHDLPGVS